MLEIPYGEPDSIRAGDTLQWKRVLSDYPADVWTLTYSLLSSSGKIIITGSASGTDHLIDEDATTTADYTAGAYDWVAHVSDATDRFTLEYGTIEVLPDLSAASTYDNRTHAKTMLDAIEAALEGQATNSQLDQISFTHGPRALSSDKSILIQLRSRYKSEVESEEQAENIRKGLGTGRTVHTRFAS